ncbi:hypothetical protein [Bartonella machadoae]|uniref:hypothetical protein n=1 Tax=Bartonella machadoae TaxID=2893471 RepID=UPI001F4CA023|nr:hypothetical protein [Bartonella machadoae]UNE54975.1 hypothetical protein LNM86_03790 [Bartonella machadoae]UNE55365.1 hypothetical protein LNM86_06060 [Bartonella machadoae]
MWSTASGLGAGLYQYGQVDPEMKPEAKMVIPSWQEREIYAKNLMPIPGDGRAYIDPYTGIPHGNHPPLPNALMLDQQMLTPKVDDASQNGLSEITSPTPPPEPTDLDKFLQSDTYKFFQSDPYQKLQDLFAGMAAAPSGGSGWDALASGVERLNQGDKERKKVNQTVEYLKSQGMSEEEARFIAGNKAALNAVFAQKLSGGSDNPQFTSDGRMLVKDPNALGGYRYLITEGSKAYDEMKNREQMKKLQIVDAQITRKSTSRTIKEALNILKKKPQYATGPIGQLFQDLWNTPAASLKGHLESIKAGTLLKRLERIKSLSPNGSSGLGPLSDKEGVKLENAYAALQQGLPAKELIRNLQYLEEVYNKLTDAQLSLLLRDDITPEDVAAAFGSNLPVVTSKEQEDALPRGTRFIGEDGKQRRKN